MGLAPSLGTMVLAWLSALPRRRSDARGVHTNHSKAENIVGTIRRDFFGKVSACVLNGGKEPLYFHSLSSWRTNLQEKGRHGAAKCGMTAKHPSGMPASSCVWELVRTTGAWMLQELSVIGCPSRETKIYLDFLPFLFSFRYVRRVALWMAPEQARWNRTEPTMLTAIDWVHF